MTKTENWSARVIYILVALALAAGLLLSPALSGNVSASPDESEWLRVSTPTAEDWKVAPQSMIYGFAANSEAAQLYAWGRGIDVDNLCYWTGGSYNVSPTAFGDPYSSPKWADCEDRYIIPQLWASDTLGCSWKAITKNLLKGIEDDLGPDYSLLEINFVTCGPVDGDFVVVAVILWHDDNHNGVVDSAYNGNPAPDSEVYQHVFISDDAGTTFVLSGDLPVPAAAGSPDCTGPQGTYIMGIFCTTEIDGKVNIGVGGVFDPLGLVPTAPTAGACFYPEILQPNGDEVGVYDRLETGGLFGSWKDTTNPSSYPGWDNLNDGDDTNDIMTVAVSFPWWGYDYATGKDVMAVCHVDTTGDGYADSVYVQYGTWGSTKGWNLEAGFPEAILVVDGPSDWWTLLGSSAGITPPVDWNSRYASKRYNWVYVNLEDVSDAFPGETPREGGVIFRMLNDSVEPIIQQIPDLPVLTNVAYWGFIESGKAIAGVIEEQDCCEGVQVWRNNAVEDMEICCKGWKDACKPPSGLACSAVGFVSDNLAIGNTALPGHDYDESAFSFSLDDGDTWNQVGLIDTKIDYISDVAVSPDCNKTYLATINECSDCECECGYGCGETCDSVWLYAEDLPEDDRFSACWIRVWHGVLEEYDSDDTCGDIACFDDGTADAILRLSPDETTGETIYLVNRGTSTVWYSGGEGLDCWEEGESNIDEIVDLAVKDEATIYALGEDGKVSMSDDHGFPASWSDEVDSKVDTGHTIAVMGDWVLVGGHDADVSYSDDAGDTFTQLDDVGCGGCVHVAFDSYFDDNSTIYAALSGDCAEIDRWVIGDSTDWKDLGARDAGDGYSYYGVVLSNPDGNPMTDATTGGVLYATYTWYDGNYYGTGVARLLNPAEDICCESQDWDYLEAGLDVCQDGEESFDLEPSSLKICGCLTADSNVHLFAIDNSYYGYYSSCCDEYCCITDYDDCDCACYGRLWTYEDCFSKGAPDLISIANGSMVPADACYCINQPVTLKWDRMCNACSYDIEISLDEDFTELVYGYDPLEEYEPPKGDAPSLLIASGDLECNQTYYWRVRAADAETGEIIHSWWTDPWSFTVEVGPGGAIELTAPDNGVTNVPVTGISFTWTTIPDGATYDWVLSANADLSSPVDSQTGLTSAAYTFTGTLDKDAAYYWQVTAKRNGVTISMSQISTFTTAPEKPAPPAPAPAPRTPTWVWVIIAIGAVLVIVVIVLIFRTRRV
jgi:hypothetical protein